MYRHVHYILKTIHLKGVQKESLHSVTGIVPAQNQPTQICHQACKRIL